MGTSDVLSALRRIGERANAASRKAKAVEFVCSRIRIIPAEDAEFDESKHPRAENGEFTEKGAGVSGSSRDADLTKVSQSLEKAITSTTLSALKYGKVKDHSITETHKRLRTEKKFAEARQEAVRLAANPDTAECGDYLLAKYHKDDAAAQRVVERCLKDQTIDRIVASLDPSRPVIFVPLQNVEGEGNNRIPFLYAKELAGRLPNAVMADSVGKVSAEHNTGASSSDRVQRQFKFEGSLANAEGAQVVIVDDTWTSGQTCVSMMEYLKVKHPGIDIKGITCLASSRYGYDIKPSEERIAKVLQKSGLSDEKEFERVMGFPIRSRTGCELQIYLLGGRKGVAGLKEKFGG